MLREGQALAPVAAALASPETAERIAVLEAATGGGMSALEEAKLNVRRAGLDLTLLDRLRVKAGPHEGGNGTAGGNGHGALEAAALVPLGLEPVAGGRS
jgi:hypothetical protein